jgi:tRNA(fMet)-specific endonuclease VapC
MQIAAIAIVHGLIVVTHNTNEFGRVPRLKIEDWEV